MTLWEMGFSVAHGLAGAAVLRQPADLSGVLKHVLIDQQLRRACIGSAVNDITVVLDGDHLIGAEPLTGIEQHGVIGIARDLQSDWRAYLPTKLGALQDIGQRDFECAGACA